jgi:hypothetical protein
MRRDPVGAVYRAEISVEDLYQLVRFTRIHYSPRSQRGFSGRDDRRDEEFDQLMSLTDERVQIKNSRAEEMAVKLLMGRLFSANVVWNARVEDGVELIYDADAETLEIPNPITVPDTAHRHRCYYLLGLWKRSPEKVPAKVTIFENQEVTRDQILELLEQFDPEATAVFLDVYNVTRAQEGELYDEFNSESKPPSSATAIDQFPTKTPARRFMLALMDKTAIFNRDEIETRFNTIGSKSRKLTTNATMVAAIKGMTRSARELADLESDEERYDDLIAIFDAFFTEWAVHFPAFEPGTEQGPRHALRADSFALSNIIMHPLFKLVFDLWREYDERGEDWTEDQAWKDSVARLGGTRRVTNLDYSPERHPESEREITVAVMARNNPEWRERILVPKYNNAGVLTDWVLSSTRQTREAAYAYLREVAELPPTPDRPRRTRAAA